jgi:hypothetical protein
MPKTPIDYSKTIIYKLVHNEDYDNANVYIGSTTDFVKRKNQHKNSCNNEKQKDHNSKKYQYIRENGGWNEWRMIEVEKHNCNDGNEARAREEYWRCYFNAQLNTNRAYITKEQEREQIKERNDRNKDKHKEYREQHKEKITEYQKEYREQNGDKLSEYTKEYREQNKDKLLEQKKELLTCECGCMIRRSDISRHRKSQKHLLQTKQIKYEFVDESD